MTILIDLVRNLLLAVVFLLCLAAGNRSAHKPPRKKAPTPGPMLNQGIVNYDTPDFTLSLVRSSQTVAALKPKGADGFDFTPRRPPRRAFAKRILPSG